MAKKIKMPLILNGAACRTIADVQKNWDMEEIYNFFIDGKLLTWCQDYRYIQAGQISALSKDDSDVRKKICDIFSVEYIPTESDEDNSDWQPKDSEEQEKFDNFKRITDDKRILKKFRQAAFDRDELIDLLDEEFDEIYLCDNTFEDFPIADENKTYIGVGNAVAVIPSKEIIDFDARKIKFVNVKFDDAYQKLFGQNQPEPKFFPSTPQKKSSENQAEEFFKLAEQEEYVKKDYSAAFGLYKKAAELGHSEAMNKLGQMYYDGKGTEKNLNEAFKWCKKSYDSGNVHASYDLAWLYNCGAGTEKNLYKAFNLLQEAEKAEIFKATIALGLMYLKGGGTTVNPQKAFECFRKAVMKGDNDAVTYLADMYYNGEGTPQDFDKAFELYEKAADLGNTSAMRNLAYMYEKNGDYDRAESWYKKAVELGNVSAINDLGEFYLVYVGDYGKALQYFLQAADKGNANAMFNLATMHKDGIWVRKDVDKAQEWLIKAAEAGHNEAQEICNESGIYYNGQPSDISYNTLADDIEFDGRTASTTVTVVNDNGFNVRTASLFVLTAEGFKSKIKIQAKGKVIDGKSILMIMSSGLVKAQT